MSKIIPLIFSVLFFTASCTHNNLEAHFQKSRTGWTKEEVFKSFGPPDESYEDTNFKYYVYKYIRGSKNQKNTNVLWHVKYVFKNNKVVELIKERQATAKELDKLEVKTKPNNL